MISFDTALFYGGLGLAATGALLLVGQTGVWLVRRGRLSVQLEKEYGPALTGTNRLNPTERYTRPKGDQCVSDSAGDTV